MVKHFFRIFFSYQLLFVLLPSLSEEGGLKCYATHLMGGWAGYEYLGLNSATGNYKYKVIVKVYRYCDDSSLPCGTCTNAALDSTIQLGAYTQGNPNDPNKVLAASFLVPRSSRTWVPLPGAGQCASAPVVCVEEGLYTLEVELPPSNGGYHLIFERCCRNFNIINLANPGGEGQTYYAFIPPTFVNNSSPVLALPPVPYICVNDTASILNTAIDSDGDVIVYSLVRPYSDSTGAAAPPPVNPYVFPISLVTYAPTYNATQPFGASGYASINSFTGLSQYLSPTTGNYVVAVEMQEYRNNQLVGVTRLDMQIIVINCPPNNAPALSSTTSQTSFVANAGDSLCFPITFSDVNGDSVFLTSSGTLFGAPTNPPATLTPNPNSGIGTITSEFCWDLACAQTGNYIFIVQSPDNGCPPKVANVVYTIQVLPYAGPSFISGPSPLCSNTSGTYSVPAASGTSFTWTVTSGSITSGQGTNSIDVNWGGSTTGTVDVISYNANGCPAGPISLNVNIQSAPGINAGPNSTICPGSSVPMTSNGGVNYTWSPAGGLNNPNISNPVASPTATTNYVVTVISSIGCSNTDTVSISVHPAFALNAGNDNTVCTGSMITLGGSPSGPAGSTYEWSPANGLSNSTAANPTVSLTSNNTYTLIVSSAAGCNDTDLVAVQVTPLPIASAGGDITMCPGFNTTLSGNGGGTYNWSPASTLNNSTISNPVASPTSSTTYTLVVTLNNCSDTDFVAIATLPQPAVNAGADLSVCVGNSATLNATGTGTFVWSPSTGLSCTTCANPVSTPTANTTYTVVITDASTCTNSDVIQVTSNALPLANAGPRPGWVCPGFGITLNASNGVTYNWAPAASLSNSAVSNPVATPTTTTTYSVNITDANGCSNRDTVTILYTPAVPTNAGANNSICRGQSYTLGSNPTSPLGATYQWSPVTGLNNSSIANPVASPLLTTTYIVTTSSDTCNGADTVIVFVNTLPIISAGADMSVCSGSSATLSASGGISYSWNTGETTTSISVAPTSISTYTVIGTDANSCSNIDSVSVSINALPAISAGADISACNGSTATLTGSGGQSYVWSTGETTTSIVVAPGSFSSYTLTGTDANGCSNVDSASVFINSLLAVNAGADVSVCSGGIVILTVTGGQSYSWSTGETTTSISVAPTSSATYTVIGIGANGCSAVDSVFVFVGSLPIVSAGADVSVCLGSNTTLSASGGQLFTWSPAGTLSNPNVSNPVATPVGLGAITYTLTATDANACSNIDTVTIYVLGLPLINASNDTIVCVGDSVFLNASGGTAYSWTPASSLNNSTISNPIATPTINTTYTVTATNPEGCANSEFINVVVNQLPLIDAGINTVVCPGNAVTLIGTGGIAYSWSPSTGLSNPTISNPNATPSVITTYTVTGTDGNGCTNTDVVTVSIGVIPTANFGYSLSLACDGMQAHFSDSSLNATAWLWNFGAGPISALENPTYAFPYGNNYNIILTALNPPCSDTAQTTISVNALSGYLNIQTSNVFTPNNDGDNDCFRFNTNGRFEGCADLSIYNRWGIPVYYSEHSGSCWDGYTTAGVLLPQGTYFYMYNLNGIQLKGFITLLR